MAGEEDDEYQYIYHINRFGFTTKQPTRRTVMRWITEGRTVESSSQTVIVVIALLLFTLITITAIWSIYQ